MSVPSSGGIDGIRIEVKQGSRRNGKQIITACREDGDIAISAFFGERLRPLGNEIVQHDVHGRVVNSSALLGWNLGYWVGRFLHAFKAYRRAARATFWKQ